MCLITSFKKSVAKRSFDSSQKFSKDLLQISYDEDITGPTEFEPNCPIPSCQMLTTYPKRSPSLSRSNGTSYNNSTSLNVPYVTVSIPLIKLKDDPENLLHFIKTIGLETDTCIYTFEAKVSDEVEYAIYGKWRNCMTAKRLISMILTVDSESYCNSSWVDFLKIPWPDLMGKTLPDAYRVKIRIDEKNNQILRMTGYEGNLQKMKRDMVLRTKPKVVRMSGDLLITTFPKDAPEEEADSRRILDTIFADYKNPVTGDESLKPTDIIRLIFGPLVSSATIDATPILKMETSTIPSVVTDSTNIIKNNEKTIHKEIYFDPSKYTHQYNSGKSFYHQFHPTPSTDVMTDKPKEVIEDINCLEEIEFPPQLT